MPDMFESYVTDEHLWVIADAALWAAEAARTKLWRTRTRQKDDLMNKGTGRLKSPDPRDRMYALPPGAPQAAGGVTKRTWRSPASLTRA